MNNITVPVIMLHSVGIPNKKWNSNYLTCPYTTFENQLIWLKNHNYQTISLEQLYSYMSHGTKIPRKSVILTFDDGYVDNWIFAYPLLKKYNMNATVYVNPEFTESRKEYMNLDDVWEKRSTISELNTLGYLSWKELKIMEDDGVFDVQSHSMTHTWYPCSEKIIDFRHHGDQYFWMTWNEHISKKPYLQLDDENLINYGQPVYENGRSIGIKRYFPDQELNNFLISFYEENKDSITPNIFHLKMSNVLADYKNKNEIYGRYETDQEYNKRIYYELAESKKILEKNLEKEINFLCWPGGAVTGLALSIAEEVGYKSSTIGKDLNNQRNILKNKFGENPSRINRIGNIMFWDAKEICDSKIKYMNGLELFLFVSSYKTSGLTSKILLIPLFCLNKLYTIGMLL